MTSTSRTYATEKVRIGIFGRVNAGKSTLLNYLTGTDTAIVSDRPGTTTDPIRKSMEVTGLGPVIFVDTAGSLDESELGDKRLGKSKIELSKVDLIIYVLSKGDDLSLIKDIDKPVVFCYMKKDLGQDLSGDFKDKDPLGVDIRDKTSRDEIFSRIGSLYKKEDLSITKDLVGPGDMVVLVMPQDAAAPKGRLIKPQVMTIREIIDKKASAITTDLSNLKASLDNLKKVDLVITDSKVFKEVYEIVGDGIPLTSFSVLFSAFKGDLRYFVESSKVLDKGIKRVLIAEACTHPPIVEDIGTVKIPRLLRKFYPDLEIDFLRGDGFIAYEDYDLIISCGACMFNRAFVLDRVSQAKKYKTPMTNYGIVLAKLSGILEKISLPADN